MNFYPALLLLGIIEVLTLPDTDTKDTEAENHNLKHIYNVTALYSALGTSALKEFLNPFFEEFSCMDMISGANPSILRQSNLIYTRKTEIFRDFLAGNSTNDYEVCMDGRRTKLKFSCIINRDKFCDGYSSCLLDECGCEGEETFLCADKSGCIALSQVCVGPLRLKFKSSFFYICNPFLHLQPFFTSVPFYICNPFLHLQLFFTSATLFYICNSFLHLQLFFTSATLFYICNSFLHM